MSRPTAIPEQDRSEGSRASDDLAERDKRFILHPHQVVGAPQDPLIVARGRGARIWDVEGREYVDGTCGLWQCAVGHGRPELARVAASQLEQLEFYASFWDLSNPPAIELAERLVDLAPAGIEKVYFTSGGSEGNATAIKLARLAWSSVGQDGRDVILARKRAYHGMGGLSGAATDLPMVKEGIGPLPPQFVHLTTPHERHLGDDAVAVLIDELEQTIERIGARRVAALIGEPVMGVGGMIPPPDGYWPAVEAVLRRRGILLILDEVVTAFGRLGSWFAADYYGVKPDMIVTAKGLTSGYIPMGAVLLGARVLELLDGAAFRHGFTYNGHPAAAAVALKNLEIIEDERLAEHAIEIGGYMLERLRPLEENKNVAEIRGVGLMIGIELAHGDATVIAARARQRGIIVRANQMNLVLSPPLVIEQDEADKIIDTLTEEIEGMEAG
jgi:adenosylmethionine-8-amino-7-oxononanoate aminotransferase